MKNTNNQPPLAWAIGGMDPAGYAGLLADVACLRAWGVRAATLTTALTAQNLSSYVGTFPIEARIIESQANALLSEAPPQVVKTGMLADGKTAQAVADIVQRLGCPVIVDPVLRSTSGSVLMSDLDTFIDRVLPLASLITPNVEEAAALAGMSIRGATDYPEAARRLMERGARAVLIKDGHGNGVGNENECADYYVDANQSFWLMHPRVPKKVRGTGCCLASAIAAGLALTGNIAEAVVTGVAYAHRGIRLADPLFHHGTWPVSSEDFPRLIRDLKSPMPTKAFACVGPNPMGFYPVVPTADWVERLVEWGVDMIQLRAKDGYHEEIEAEVMRAIAAARRTNCRLFINDHWRLALKHGAYGVHLGQTDLDDFDWRLLQDAGLRLGLSTHSYAELAHALSYRPSYVALGPVFATTTKVMPWNPQGMGRIAIWSQLSAAPLVAIGGMTIETAADALAAGADGIAVVRAITLANAPREEVERWQRAVRRDTRDIRDTRDLRVPIAPSSL